MPYTGKSKDDSCCLTEPQRGLGASGFGGRKQPMMSTWAVGPSRTKVDIPMESPSKNMRHCVD